MVAQIPFNGFPRRVEAARPEAGSGSLGASDLGFHQVDGSTWSPSTSFDGRQTRGSSRWPRPRRRIATIQTLTGGNVTITVEEPGRTPEGCC